VGIFAIERGQRYSTAKHSMPYRPQVGKLYLNFRSKSMNYKI